MSKHSLVIIKHRIDGHFFRADGFLHLKFGACSNRLSRAEKGVYPAAPAISVDVLWETNAEHQHVFSQFNAFSGIHET